MASPSALFGERAHAGRFDASRIASALRRAGDPSACGSCPRFAPTRLGKAWPSRKSGGLVPPTPSRGGDLCQLMPQDLHTKQKTTIQRKALVLPITGRAVDRAVGREGEGESTDGAEMVGALGSSKVLSSFFHRFLITLEMDSSSGPGHHCLIGAFGARSHFISLISSSLVQMRIRSPRSPPRM